MTGRQVGGSAGKIRCQPANLPTCRPILRPMKTSRRAFVGASAAAATHMWIPNGVSGYSAEEMIGPVTPHKAGISKWDLDTPALCVDLDKMQRNIDKMQRTCSANKIAVRPHAKTHKCAEIAKLQMK